MEVLDLFSGIGGFSLAADAVGFRTIAFCECEPYPVRVLNRHWPDVPVFPDVKELTADALADASDYRLSRRSERDGEAGARGSEQRSDATGCAADMRRPTTLGGGGQSEAGQTPRLLLTAGFPCQDISYAGKGAGLEGQRSGLFYEVARLIGELGPDFVLLENVAALLTRGLDAVLGTLASLGYDALWACIPACAVGAPHRRDRVWIVACPQSPDSAERLQAIYASVLSNLAPFGDLSDGWPTATASDSWASERERERESKASTTSDSDTR